MAPGDVMHSSLLVISVVGEAADSVSVLLCVTDQLNDKRVRASTAANTPLLCRTHYATFISPLALARAHMESHALYSLSSACFKLTIKCFWIVSSMPGFFLCCEGLLNEEGIVVLFSEHFFAKTIVNI